MFTGLVQAVGSVVSVKRAKDSAVFTFKAPDFLGDSKVGDSISVNGVCLTAIAINGNTFDVDVMVQTLNLTSLKGIDTGSSVNLELAAKVSDRLGGHIVQGHVDGVGSVLAITPGEKWQRVDIAIPSHLMKYVQPQGSICIDGTSLTVGELNDEKNSLSVWLIPETLRKTTLGLLQVGTLVNIEVDVLAKYVERLMKRGEA
ncbi:MAG: riboflavin synthase [Actinomycetes bacterium]